MCSSSIRDSMGADTTALNELSHLFSPEYCVKKEDIQPFVSILNGIKHEYWDNAEKFQQVIGLLHQLKLDTSTQVLEYHQLLIRNRLSYLLQDTPELLETLLETISDASNNRRHVLNARPTSVGFQTIQGKQHQACKPSGVNLFGSRPSTTFVIKNNVVTLPWQPWFAHIVPKSSIAGRTILRLQGGGKPYSLMMPNGLTGSSQQVVTTTGLVTVQPPTRVATATYSTAGKHPRQTAEFDISRKLYEQIPSSLQCPKAAMTTQEVNKVQPSVSEHNRQALLKKQQEFLQQLALLKTEQKGNHGCNKRLFPPHTSSPSNQCQLFNNQLLPTGPQLILNDAGDNGAKGMQQSQENHEQSQTVSSGKHLQMATQTQSGKNNIRMATRQSTIASKLQTDKVKFTVTNRRKSPRNKNKNGTLPSSTSQRKSGHSDKEKGLVLSRVSEHCIVISVPNQSSGSLDKIKTRSNTTTADGASPVVNSERRKKHKKKKRRISVSDDNATSTPTKDKAFSKVQKLHKKRHKAWMKEVARSKIKLAQHKSHHREVSSTDLKLEDKSEKIKISSHLFKTKHRLNKNNSCSTTVSNAHAYTMGMKTPRKRRQVDTQETPTPSAYSDDLLSPSCFVSLKKMKLNTDGDVQLSKKAQVQYAVDSSASFPYCQHLSIPVNKCDKVPLSDDIVRRHSVPAASEGSNACDTTDNDSQDDYRSFRPASVTHSQQEQESLVEEHDESTSSLAYIDVLGGSDSEFYNAPCSMDENVIPVSHSTHKLPIMGGQFEHDLERGTHLNAYSAHSFLGRLLTSPSPPAKIQHANTHTRQRKPKEYPNKVRKSKRQKRKRKKEHKKACRTGSKP